MLELNSKKSLEENLRENIDNFYTKEMCMNLYNIYLKNWIADGYIGEKLNIFELSLVDEKTSKDFYINLIFEVFESQEKFEKAFEDLTADVKILFENVVWQKEYKIDTQELEKYFKNFKEKQVSELDVKFQFFKFKQLLNQEIIIYLDYEIEKVLRGYLKKPRDYFLYDSSEEMQSQNTLYRDDNEKEFINNMAMYLEFSNSGLIKVSESGKILKDSKKDMLKHCNITEYYGDLSNLEYLKTENICMFLTMLADKYKDEKYFNSSNMKNIIYDFIATKNINQDLHYPYTTLFLNYLKGVKNIWEAPENLKAVAENLISILKEMKENDCLSIKNIIKAFIYREKNIEIVSYKDVRDYIYINEANYERTKIQKYTEYEEFVIEPFIKSYLFLLGTLGVFELFYTKPEENSKIYIKAGYLSQFNGLKYIKLTSLGKYVLGFSEKYEIPLNYEKSEIFLDDKRLIVTILGESPTRRMFFEKISKKIGNNIYKITIDSFKRTVKSSNDLKERIEKFKNNVGNINLPENWQEFFDNLVKKYSLIEEAKDFIVLKLKEDRELLQIIAKDNRFKGLFLKAEDYHILIKKDKIEELAKILKEYGYHFDYDYNENIY